jgi:hypothetical protein
MSYRPLIVTACLALCCLPALQAKADTCNTAKEKAVASHWFRQLNQAWERRDAAAATALFSSGATYWDDPFGAPQRGVQEIRAYWDQVATGQHAIHTSYEVLSACGGMSVIHWTADFTRIPSGQKVRLDGIAEIVLDRNGEARSFREWWNRDQT